MMAPLLKNYLHSKRNNMYFKSIITIVLIPLSITLIAQPSNSSHWTTDGNGYYSIAGNQIMLYDLNNRTETEFITKDLFKVPNGEELKIKDFAFSKDQTKVLLFTNSQRVWRYETRGDYWVLNRNNNQLQQLGTSLPSASLMFAKISPDGRKAAYVSNYNVYVEDLDSKEITQLTDSKGLPKLINGTFDWAYEEEFDCRDGFRWSPDSKKIAYWQIDANDIRDFYMINTTDSIYSHTVPVEYPKVGETPAACRLGVVDIETGKTNWIRVPGDERQNYIPRMEWAGNSKELIFQQLNRKQNHSKLMYADVKTGLTRVFYQEKDDAWISVRSKWENDNGWYWLKGGNAFLWVTEKDGWRHLYRVPRNGKNEVLVTRGNFDVISPLAIDEAAGYVYYTASPDNATESYLYRSKIDGTGNPERITPDNQVGSHSYSISPSGKHALHRFSNYFTRPMREWVTLPSHAAASADNSIASKYTGAGADKSNVEFFQVTTEDGVTMDGYMAYPNNFDPTKKYPALFYVYSEPAGATVKNRWGVGKTGQYTGSLADDGYIYISMDNRGTPAPKGREWRKSIYRKIGIINIQDQAMGVKALLKQHSFIDEERIAVHGWSGGGSATLNLLFKYPEIYKTGISVAAVANQLTYDNIYQERYMGIPQENREDFVNGSPITYAKNLEGNLLYIHGTADDNVHYQNAELLINELIKHQKQFTVMPYPNRSHGIYEGEGTRAHLNTLFTNYLRTHCPPGARDPQTDNAKK